jgi:hypothetical protein
MCDLSKEFQKFVNKDFFSLPEPDTPLLDRSLFKTNLPLTDEHLDRATELVGNVCKALDIKFDDLTISPVYYPPFLIINEEDIIYEDEDGNEIDIQTIDAEEPIYTVIHIPGYSNKETKTINFAYWFFENLYSFQFETLKFLLLNMTDDS